MFPFSYLGSTYTTCTEQESPTGEAWCATRVDDDGDYLGKWGYCNAACGVQDCPNDQRCVTPGSCAEFSDLNTVREYKIGHNESTEEVDLQLGQFQACDGDKICCRFTLVAGMTVEEMENLPYPDLHRRFAEAFIDDKAFILEKMNVTSKRKLMIDMASEDKQYILSNYPRVFAQTVESFTWERRKRQEIFSRTIENISQETFKMDLSFRSGSSIGSVHELLLQNRVIAKRKALVSHMMNFREKYTGDAKFQKRMDDWWSRAADQQQSSSSGLASTSSSPSGSSSKLKLGAGIRGIPNKLKIWAKQEQAQLTRHAKSNPNLVAVNIGQALWKGKQYLGARAKQAGVSFENKMAVAGNSIQGVAGGFKKIRGGDTMTKVSGVLDILGSVSAFAGPAGPFISGTCGFVNVILDLAGAGGPSLQEQIGDMIMEQTKEIKKYIDTSLWNQAINNLVRKLEAFQQVQREKYIFMDAVLSGEILTPDDFQAALTLHGSLFGIPTLHEAANFFRNECRVRFTSRFSSRVTRAKELKRKACAKLLFTYTGLATITDITNTKLVSVLAAANLHNVKRGLLALIKERKRTAKEFLSEIFTRISRTNGVSCNYDCRLTIHNWGTDSLIYGTVVKTRFKL